MDHIKNKDYKTIMFHKLAQSIGAVKSTNDTNSIDIDDLIFDSSIFLTQNGIVTNKELKKLEVFKDHYNRYVEYTLKNNLINKNKAHKIDNLKVTAIPDFSKIEIPDIKDELKELNIDISKVIDIFKNATHK